MGTFASKLAARLTLGIVAAAALPALSPATAMAAKGTHSGGSTSTTKDTTPPAVSITGPANGATVSASFTASGSASDNVGVAYVQVSVDNGTYQTATGTTSWSYAASGLASGSHTLTAKAVDGAGNSSTASVSVTVATTSGGTTATPPTSTITQPRYDNAIVGGTYTLTGTSSDSTYTVVKEQWAVDGTVVATGAYPASFSYAWDTTKVAQGAHTLTYTSWNSAGASSSASRPVTVGTATVKRIGVILYNFSDQAPPTTPQQVADWTFGSTRSVAGYYQEESYGRLLLGGQYNTAGDVFGFYTIPYTYPTTTTCDFSSWENSALQQATGAGVNLGGYDVVMLTAAVPAGCGSGNATPTQDRVPWNNPQTADDWIAFAGHELGHSFGIDHHAGSWVCTDSGGHAVQVGGTCTGYEYGDPYDIMGMGHVQHMNGWEKGQLGFFAPGNVLDVTKAGTYTLAPLTAPSSGVQLIRVPFAYDASGHPTDFYYIEYRQPAAYDVPISGVTDYDGVLVREAPDWPETTAYSHLVDTTPGSLPYNGSHDNDDAPLTAGHWFQDSTNSISVTTVSAGSTGATIQVSFGVPQCVRVAPTVTMGSTSQSGPAGSQLQYPVTIANNDSPACGASDLTLTASLPSGFTQSPQSTTVGGLYPAGATWSTVLYVSSPSNASSGTYSFTETVSDGSSGQSGSATASAGVS